MVAEWKDLAKAKQGAILDAIPAKWRLDRIPSADEQKDVTGDYAKAFFSNQEIEITEADAVTIAAKVASGTWSAVVVTEAFCHRASVAHQLLNCLHEVFFDAALADAKELDAYYAEHKKTKGPLHGVPVSLKDQFHVKDVETSMGYVGWLNTFEGKKHDSRAKTFESEMVRELRECGAILYCKTSVPHTLMSGETVNNIIGYTWNPKNRYLCSGGSSGGEGALIGFRGSPVGLGTDIGGSVRIPAGFNGLYGLRTSSGRLPYEGMANSMDGQNSILSVVGPLATTIGGLKLIMKSILSREPWLYDPLVVDMPWRTKEEQTIIDIVQNSSGKKLAFGLMASDNIVNPMPPISRAIQIVVDALRKAGHVVIEWKPPSHAVGNDIVGKIFQFDGGKDLYDAFGLSGEQRAAQIGVFYTPEPSGERTASQISATNVAKRIWQKQYMDYWNSTISQTETGRPVDGVICPLAPFPAPKPLGYKYYGYSTFVNGLDYTSLTVPVTTADKNLDKYPEGYEPLNDDDKEVYDSYDAALWDGAHCSIQLLGRRFAEEKTIAIGEYVSSLLGK